MKTETPQTPGTSSEEIAELIEILHQTEQRLEQLTGGEVDTVTNRAGQTMLLQHAQEQLRRNEAARQLSILNTLPASIALLDSQGTILSVNEAWQQFGHANAAHDPSHDIGVNYLTICDQAPGDDAAEASPAAAGIRAVLDGKTDSFTFEYPCHSPLEQRWFQMTVTPLTDYAAKGAVVMHLNITANKLAEIALRESEAQYRLLVGAMDDGVVLQDENAAIIAANKSAERILGLSAEQLQGKTSFDPDWRSIRDDGSPFPGETHPVVKTLKTGIPQSDVTMGIHKPNGELTWIAISAQPIFKEGATTPYRIVATMHDITERRRVEIMLRESERRYSDLLGNVELVSMMLDREARITYCNDYLLRLTGWQREEVIGKNWWDIFIPPEIQDLRNAFYTSLMNDQPEARHHENDIITRSGERRLIRWNNSVLRSAAGAVTGIASIGEDITERNNAEAALLESRRMLRLILDTIPVRVFWKDADLNFLGCNHPFAMDAGLHSPEELIGKNDLAMPWADQAEAYRADDRVVIDRGKSKLNFEELQTSADGRSIWLHTSKVPLVDAKGKINGVLGTYEVITERKKADARIAHLNRVLLVLSSINTLIVRVNDLDELFQESCNIAIDAGGFRMAMLVIVDPVTRMPVTVTSAGKQKKHLAAIKKVLSSPEEIHKTLIWKSISKNKNIVSNDTRNDPSLIFGRFYTRAGVKSMSVVPLSIAGEAVGAIALYSSEIDFFQEDEMKLLSELAGNIAFAIDHIGRRERLNYLAYYDLLTGLANRTMFLERVAQYIRSAESGGHQLALGLIDLERFKNINDSLGRAAGDAVLKQVAEWLIQFAQDAKLLARIDADHFAFVLPEVRTNRSLIQLVDNFTKTFQAHLFHDNNTELRLAAKTGIALFPDDGSDAETVYANAEAALKTAKRNGERHLFYTKKMTEAVAVKLTLENQLRQAIDNEEFVLHYQPKVNLVSGKVTSAEGLIRWNDPLTGLVPPGQFIPILEETGLIFEVGRWALRQAVTDWLRWYNAGLPAVRIAVNVSSLQLRNANFIDEIRQVLSLGEHAAEGLELEITESLIMQDTGSTTASLAAIRALGISIAIDDFGTGFSSLSYLSRLAVDTLKIDRSFVIEMDKPEGRALVASIIAMAHALQLKVVAEGVETERQMRQILSLGCDEMQGFLFSKPVPADIFEAKFLAPLKPHDKR
jgi:diguanylate cyclase (GGDEF)-like protein/PAS domain S-box-containing protein